MGLVTAASLQLSVRQETETAAAEAQMQSLGVRDKHNLLAQEVVELRESFDHVSGRVSAMEARAKNVIESAERKKDYHVRVLEGKSEELRSEVRKEHNSFIEGARNQMERMEKDLQMLQTDRTWLMCQEKSLSERCEKLEKQHQEVTKASKDEIQQHAKRNDSALKALTDAVNNNRGGASQADLDDRHHLHNREIDLLRAECKEFRETHALDQEVADTRLRNFESEAKRNQEQIRLLHEKLQTAVMNGFLAVDKQFRDVLAEQVAILRKEISEGQAEHTADRQMLDERLQAQIHVLEAAHQELHTQAIADKARTNGGTSTANQVGQAMQGVEQRLQGALAEHASAIGQRIELGQEHTDAKHRELQVSVERRHRDQWLAIQAREETVDQRLQELQDASDATKSVGKDNGSKLHAVTYSLLDLIEEAELTGPTSEAREKREKLHKDLVARVSGGQVSQTAKASSSPARASASTASKASPTSPTRNIVATSKANESSPVPSTRLPPLTARGNDPRSPAGARQLQ